MTVPGTFGERSVIHVPRVKRLVVDKNNSVGIQT